MGLVLDIKPYLGVGDLTLGMTPEEVRAILGPVIRSMRNRVGGIEEFREGIKVCYAQPSETVTDFELFPPAAAIYRGIDLLSCSSPLAVLMMDDPAPLEGMGIVVFFKLGVAITGFSDADNSDKAIGLFARGRWDSLRDQMRPLDINLSQQS